MLLRRGWRRSDIKILTYKNRVHLFRRRCTLFLGSIFGNVALNVTIVRCAVFGFFNFTGENRTNAESKQPLI
jgi:hypothetical protein